MERHKREGQYSDHFGTDTDARLKCRCCGSLGPGYPKVLFDIAEDARKFFDEPIIVNSGYRCPRYNDRVDGSDFSTHMAAEALDLGCPPSIDYAEFFQFFYNDERVRGLGKYTRQRFVHIDVADRAPRDIWGQ